LLIGIIRKYILRIEYNWTKIGKNLAVIDVTGKGDVRYVAEGSVKWQSAVEFVLCRTGEFDIKYVSDYV